MPDESPRPLTYQVERVGVTRGQFRWLLVLLTLQVVMTAQTTYAPGVTTWVKERWARHKAEVAHRALVKQNEAALQQCLAFGEPADRVVWEEEPAAAAKLLAGAGYGPMYTQNGSAEMFGAYQPGAMTALPGAMSLPKNVILALQRGHNAAPVFLHGRRAAGGAAERLVVVVVNAMVASDGSTRQDGDGTMRTSIWKYQEFHAISLGRDADAEPTFDGAGGWTQLALQAGNSGVEMPVTYRPSHKPGVPGELTVDSKSVLRVYAGQADSQDPSRFTIGYMLDGVAGTIDGTLRADGKVVLEPREGRRVNEVWYPRAAK